MNILETIEGMFEGKVPSPKPAETPAIDAKTLDTMARTLWGEDCGGGVYGMRAVACVIMNRAAHPRWWGTDPLSVCLAPKQFSCWNADSDPKSDHARMLAVTAADPMFVAAQNVAAAALSGQLPDITHSADSYYALTIPAPAWAKPEQHTITIGGQAFYRTEI
jgi:N-acetylmuramoyl-L-alanine amidase